MKVFYPTLIAILLLSVQAKADKGVIRIEFDDTSMTIELLQQPKIITEEGNLMLITNSMTLALALPCKVTPIGGTDSNMDKVVIRNNNDIPINVFTIDGKKVATLKNNNDSLSLERGIYIINEKKVFIK